jgi:hypothetical protein
MEESKIEIDIEEFVKGFNPELMDVCLAWVKGAKFVEVSVQCLERFSQAHSHAHSATL